MPWNDRRNKNHRFEAISGMFAKCVDCGAICGGLHGRELEPCTSPRAALLRWNTIARLKDALGKVCYRLDGFQRDCGDLQDKLDEQRRFREVDIQVVRAAIVWDRDEPDDESRLAANAGLATAVRGYRDTEPEQCCGVCGLWGGATGGCAADGNDELSDYNDGGDCISWESGYASSSPASPLPGEGHEIMGDEGWDGIFKAPTKPASPSTTTLEQYWAELRNGVPVDVGSVRALARRTIAERDALQKRVDGQSGVIQVNRRVEGALRDKVTVAESERDAAVAESEKDARMLTEALKDLSDQRDRATSAQTGHGVALARVAEMEKAARFERNGICLHDDPACPDWRPPVELEPGSEVPNGQVLCPGCGELLDPFETYWTDGENAPCGNCELDCQISVSEDGQVFACAPDGVDRIITDRDAALARCGELVEALVTSESTVTSLRGEVLECCARRLEEMAKAEYGDDAATSVWSKIERDALQCGADNIRIMGNGPPQEPAQPAVVPESAGKTPCPPLGSPRCGPASACVSYEPKPAQEPSQPAVVARPAVVRFAVVMEQMLRDNDHKGGWEDDGWEYLWERIKDETSELEEACEQADEACGSEEHRDAWKRVREEAADVANMAMMVADVAGHLSSVELARPAVVADGGDA